MHHISFCLYHRGDVNFVRDIISTGCECKRCGNLNHGSNCRHTVKCKVVNAQRVVMSGG